VKEKEPLNSGMSGSLSRYGSKRERVPAPARAFFAPGILPQYEVPAVLDLSAYGVPVAARQC
jgi:hypothetical protein